MTKASQTSNLIDNLAEFKKTLTPSDIIDIIKIFEPDLYYEEGDSYLLLPTICHNLHQEDGSLKLYYYFNTHLFFCYTQCGESFDIYELIKKMLKLRNSEGSFGEVLQVINSKKNFDFSSNQTEAYKSITDKFRRKNQKINFKFYDEAILGSFQKLYYEGWIKDGLTISSMEKYGIRYSISKEQIIIPHYDVNNKLIGIRARNLDPLLITKGKYVPIYREGILYNHPLSYNLYGINLNKKAIVETKKAIIVEGEKSCIIADGWYGENNIVVASCGKKLNKFQLQILLNLGVTDVTIAYDRMNDTKEKDSSYYRYLYELCKKYQNYANMSFIFDRDYIINYKDAPLDSGKEIFEKLLQKKVQI